MFCLQVSAESARCMSFPCCGCIELIVFEVSLFDNVVINSNYKRETTKLWEKLYASMFIVEVNGLRIRILRRRSTKKLKNPRPEIFRMDF